MIALRSVTPAALALGLLLSMATQLRLSGLPIGPGEMFLLLALMLAGATVLGGAPVPVTPSLRTILLFWLAFLLAQCTGFVAAGLIGDRHDTGLVLHDMATYPILIATSLFCVIEPGGRRLREATAGWMVALGATFCVLQLAGAAGWLVVPGVDPWYWDRLRGWTANPNQFALCCLILVFLSLHQLAGAKSCPARVGAAAAALVATGSGVMAKTNAFTLALVAAGALLAGLKLAGSLLGARPRLSFGAVLAQLLVFGLPLVAVAALPLALSMSHGASLMGSLVRDDSAATDNEAKIRLDLWTHAVDRSFETGLLGLGPGPHLPIPTVLLEARWGIPFEPSNVDHPKPGGTPNFEAHNSFLEMLLQGGVPAVASFLAVIGAAVASGSRARQHGLVVSLVGILIFGSFHVITRHPAVWFVIVMCLASGEGLPGRRGILRPAAAMPRRAIVSS